MSKFNQPGRAPAHVSNVPTAVTYEGAPAFEQSYQMELYQSVVTSLFGEGKFYESADERGKRMGRLVRRCVENGDAEFVAKLALYARERMHLRSVPLFLVVTLARTLREVPEARFDGLRSTVTRVIQRADELREMFAAAEATFGDPANNKVFKRVAPRALLKGIGDAFNKFDAYQFRKWSGGKGSVKFTDVMRVVHPRPISEEQSELFAMIMADTLPQADTWETRISGEGSTRETWQEVANSPKTGYMAKLRNLRNFVRHDVDLTNVINHLTNPTAVANSKQLPFRFYTAYRELGGETLKHSYWGHGGRYQDTDKVQGSPELLSALEDAFDLSVANLPDLGDDVLIVVDQSGSMQSPISDKSTVTCAEIAAVLGSAVWFNQVSLGKKAMVAGFASRGKVYNWSRRTSSLSAAKQMMNTTLGGSTQIETAWSSAKDANLKPQTIVVLSDMQMTGGSGYYGYDRIMNPEDYGLANKDTLKISVNLQGYSNTPFAVNNGWYQLAGWSERLFDFVEAMKAPGDAIKLIRSYE